MVEMLMTYAGQRWQDHPIVQAEGTSRSSRMRDAAARFTKWQINCMGAGADRRNRSAK
jgi:hypothetical protein